MAVASYDPFALMNQFQHEVNRLFATRAYNRRSGQSAAANNDWQPSADVLEEGGQYVINMDVPGVDPKDIEVTMEKGVLSLRGTRAVPGATDKNGYARRECPSGSFERRFVLPDGTDAEGITAQGKNGVLQVVIPKRQKPQARRIQVEG
jgi:HSP20 family protein